MFVRELLLLGYHQRDSIGGQRSGNGYPGVKSRSATRHRDVREPFRRVAAIL